MARLVQRIIAAGQTGADRGALQGAQRAGVKVGGWISGGLRSEDGNGSVIAKEFNLTEADGGYADADRRNVDMADGMVAFLLHRPKTGRGTMKTINYALGRGYQMEVSFEPPIEGDVLNCAGARPVLLLWDVEHRKVDAMADTVACFLRQYRPKTLLVGGPCESTEPGVQQLVEEVIYKALRPTQQYDHILVMDFEANGWSENSTEWEIVEFPCVVIHGGRVVDEFRQFVRPTTNPKLSDFCKEQCKIEQEWVDKADPIDVVTKRFEEWVTSKGYDRNCAVLTCGDYDLKTALRCESERKGFPLPRWLKRWINIKVPFSMRVLGFDTPSPKKAGGMAGMLKTLQLPLVGTHHSGIDDCRNIATIALHLMEAGNKLWVTGGVDPDPIPSGVLPRACAPQYYTHILVIDFEASGPQDPSEGEIVEFPCVVIRGGKVVDEFREFVRPTRRPGLSDFCLKKCKIKQEWVDKADTIDVVTKRFERWAASKGYDRNCAVLTCGDYDLNTVLRCEAARKGFPLPRWLKRWINIKVHFSARVGKAGGMANMLQTLRLPLVGTHHCGIDDCRNIATIALHLMEQGALLTVTGGVEPDEMSETHPKHEKAKFRKKKDRVQ